MQQSDAVVKGRLYFSKRTSTKTLLPHGQTPLRIVFGGGLIRFHPPFIPFPPPQRNSEASAPFPPLAPRFSMMLQNRSAAGPSVGRRIGGGPFSVLCREQTHKTTKENGGRKEKRGAVTSTGKVRNSPLFFVSKCRQSKVLLFVATESPDTR